MLTVVTKLAGILILLSASLQACTIPVFRFALDQWRADPYILKASDEWRDSKAGKELHDLLDRSELPLRLVEAGPDAAPDQLLMPANPPKEVWSGHLDPGALKRIIDSPARDEIAKRILAGDAAVWVVVGSGNAEKDRAFEKQLAARLDYLRQVAVIPPQDPNDPDSQLGPGPELAVGFSIIQVARDDPDEQVFLMMLAGPHGRKLLDGDEPVAGAVFGRGRVLGTWTASELVDEGIDEVSLFLLGACSCRVKLLNPGWDLLMSVDWDAGLITAQMKLDQRAAGKKPPPDLPIGELPALKPGMP